MAGAGVRRCKYLSAATAHNEPLQTGDNWRGESALDRRQREHKQTGAGRSGRDATGGRTEWCWWGRDASAAVDGVRLSGGGGRCSGTGPGARVRRGDSEDSECCRVQRLRGSRRRGQNGRRVGEATGGTHGMRAVCGVEGLVWVPMTRQAGKLWLDGRGPRDAWDDTRAANASEWQRRRRGTCSSSNGSSSRRSTAPGQHGGDGAAAAKRRVCRRYQQ